MNWEPLYDKIIVRRDKAPEVLSLEANIVAAEKYKQQQNAGVVVATGVGRVDVASSRVTRLLVEPGDRVLFSRFAGTPVDPDDPDTIVLREDELLAFERSEDRQKRESE
jgi:chaperonin GroES